MSIRVVQNFYKTTLLQSAGSGTGVMYVGVKPTPDSGWLVISPANATLREIVEYESTGTDGTGDYVVTSARGVGGTIAQTHAINEPVRMNFTAEHQQEISDLIDTKISLTGNETIAGVKTFSSSPIVPTPTTDTQASNKVYSDTKIPKTDIDTDGALTANSDTKVASQKATKTYADTKIPLTYLDTDDTMAANSDTKVATQKATKAYADGIAMASEMRGPSSSTDNAIARFDSTTGKLLQDSGIQVSDDGNIYPYPTLSGNGNSIGIFGGEVAVGSNGTGGLSAVIGRMGDGSGAGGAATAVGGQGGATGAGGDAVVQGGAGGATSGDGGVAVIIGGSATAGNGAGAGIRLAPGVPNGSGFQGKITFYENQSKNIGASLDLSSIASSDKAFTFQNVSGALATVTSGAGVPTGTAPVAIGQIYVDTSAGKVYIAKGVSAGSDWAILN
jgi:hypothetical protein